MNDISCDSKTVTVSTLALIITDRDCGIRYTSFRFMYKSTNGELVNVCGTYWNDPEVGEIIRKNILILGS